MRHAAPFRPDDLAELDGRFYSKAARVVAIEDVVAGDRAPNVLGLRHDCDSAASLGTAVQMARWEAERGYRSSYYLLHTSPYWNAPEFRRSVAQIASYGHEIGLHTNALAEALRTGQDPDLILYSALERLRGFGYPVRGVAGHGDPFCNRDRGLGEGEFANDEQFSECRREGYGEADREINRGAVSMKLAPRPLADFGLEYEALWSGYPFPWRLSDSGGRWTATGFEDTADSFAQQLDVSEPPVTNEDPKQLHLLIHPDWWAQSFYRETVAA